MDNSMISSLKELSFLDLFNSGNLYLILEVLITLIIGFLAIRIIRFTIKKTILRNSSKQSVMLVSKIITYIGYSILAIIVLNQLGINLAALLGAAGILGIAIGVASQKSLGNIISGVFLVAEKSFEIGDVIKIGDKVGIVYSIDFLAIMLKTFDNTLIRIPNETLISTEITNITKFPIRRLDFHFSVSYKDDIDLVRTTLQSIAVDNILCLDEPAPFILLKDFGDSGIGFQFGVWFEKDNYVDVKNSVMREMKKRFEECGLTIPFPHITVYQGKTQSREKAGP